MDSDILQRWLPTWTPYVLSAGFILVFVGLLNLINLIKKYKCLFFTLTTENEPAYAGVKSLFNPKRHLHPDNELTKTSRSFTVNTQNSEMDSLEDLKRRLQFSIQTLSLALIAHFVKGLPDIETKQNQLILLLEEYLNTHYQLNAENLTYGWNAFFLEKNLVGKIVDMTLELKHILSKNWSDALRPDVHHMGNVSVAYLNARHNLLDNFSTK